MREDDPWETRTVKDESSSEDHRQQIVLISEGNKNVFFPRTNLRWYYFVFSLFKLYIIE